MESITYIDRTSGEKKLEKVYGGPILRFLYSSNLFVQIIAKPLLLFVAKLPLFSLFYGWVQKRSFTRRKIAPFIRNFHVDTSEFEKEVKDFTSFNDFFVRKLKSNARPIGTGENLAIIPADGRFRFFEDLSKSDGIFVKGKTFSLEDLLQDKTLADRYKDGSMVIGRLCPTDYHRFHFPCDCTPSESKLINGYLYSVNPFALIKNIEIFTENKRVITTLKDTPFGEVLYIEVGATNVGAIHQTYTANTRCKKGSEKGFFSFGGSALILLFEKGKIQFSDDLKFQTCHDPEIRCLMGQDLGYKS